MTIPYGIYSLDSVVDKPFISGVLIRLHWATFEPTEGDYDFSTLDSVLSDAQAVGQSATLTVLLGDSPQWLLDAVPTEEKYTEANGYTVIAPWSEVGQAKLYALIDALSSHVTGGYALPDHPTIKQVDCATLPANGIRMQNEPTGYTANAFNAAHQAMTAAWVAAFPDKILYQGLFGIAFDTDNAATLADTLYSQYDGVAAPKLNPYIEYWDNDSPAPGVSALLEARKSTSSILMQALKPFIAFGIDIVDAVSFAINNWGTTYFECYNADLNNAANDAAFTQAKALIDAYYATLSPPVTGNTDAALYCTTNQLITWFGAQELIQRTDREPFTGAINQPVLDDAIIEAGKEIDGYLRSVYPLPLATEVITGSSLPVKCGDIVRHLLYRTIENEEVAKRYKDAIAWLRDVQAKRVTLGVEDATVAETGTVAVYRGVSGTDWNTY